MSIFIVSFIGALCNIDITAFGQFMIYRPIFCAPLIGFFAGDIITGVCIGIISELFWTKVTPMGVSVIPDISMIGILSTFWACTYFPGLKDAAILAILLAIPFAYLYKLVDMVGRKFNTKIMYWVEDGIKNTKNWHIEAGILIGLFSFFLRAFLFYLVAVSIGNKLFCNIYGVLPECILSGFTKAWYLFPVAGFGVAYNMANVRGLFLRDSKK
ncbi:MAG: PTS sugar transporter subunit IIC [Endomicrobium sp.]|jgi:PTS system mannose-specific IIC component|nr:PTS sugar transporter subunit IIC [Endomicrobium sp.]